MSVRVQRCIMLRGARLVVLVTPSGASATPAAAADFIDQRASRLVDSEMHEHLITTLAIDPVMATVLVAELRSIGLLGSETDPVCVDTSTLKLEWNSFSMGPRQAAALARAVVGDGCRVVVEFGSGVSTIAVAAAMKLAEDGGTLLSFEQDQGWSAQVISSLAGLQDPQSAATVVTCPLHSWSEQAPLPMNRWYDLEQVTAALDQLPGPVDLLVVDGPTAYQREWRFDRYPALPVVRPYLARGAQILLDDTHRVSEATILRQWQEELGPQWHAITAGRGAWLRESTRR